jgi:hypothetical protein
VTTDPKCRPAGLANTPSSPRAAFAAGVDAKDWRLRCGVTALAAVTASTTIYPLPAAAAGATVAAVVAATSGD